MYLTLTLLTDFRWKADMIIQYADELGCAASYYPHNKKYKIEIETAAIDIPTRKKLKKYFRDLTEK